MIDQSNRLKRCFPQPPLVAYRRGKNLGDHLFRAKISTKRRSTRLKKDLNHVDKHAKCVGIVKQPTYTVTNELMKNLVLMPQ